MSTETPVVDDAPARRLSRPVRVAAYTATYILVAAVGVGGGWLGAERGVDVFEVRLAPPTAGPVTLPDLLAGDGEVTVHGDVSSLSLGRRSTLLVKVTNSGDRALKLLSLTVTPRDASASCRAKDNLRVGRYDSSRGPKQAEIIAGGGTGRVELPIILVDLPNVNQDACKNVTFPLDYAATAVVR